MPPRERKHRLRRHRWHLVQVHWNIFAPSTRAEAVCLRPACWRRKVVIFDGANLSRSLVERVFPAATWTAQQKVVSDR